MNDFYMACFLSVARTLNFALAADELYTTQQAVSRNIQNLEQELGFPLFHRHYHSIQLTLAGQEFYNCISVFSHNLSLYSRIIENDDSADSLRIGWTTWAGPSSELNAKIKDFSELYSRKLIIKVFEVSDIEILDYLRTGEVEIAFIPRYLTGNLGDEFSVLPIMEVPLNIVIEVDHPLISLPSIAGVLSALPHITSYAGEHSEDDVRKRIHREYIKLDYHPQTINILPNLESAFTEVLMGNGITFSPSNRFTNCKDLVMIPLPRTVTISAVRLRKNKNKYILWFEKYLTDKEVDFK